MELKEIKVENFKMVGSAVLKVSNLNILVGSNGSGKSSILQAVHLASCLLRQADRIRSSQTSTVSITDIDYLPSDDYSKLGHGSPWGNKEGTPNSKIEFLFGNVEGESKEQDKAVCIARSARNAGISVKGELSDSVREYFRGNYFSAFIPGISGVPNKEVKHSKRFVMRACSFGDANVYLRNALSLLSEEDLNKIEIWLGSLIGDISISLEFDDGRDLNINTSVQVGDKNFPLELLGTGYLQLVQIFCYVLLFKPKILLVDEPDIHLHPFVQEKLAGVFEQMAEQYEMKIILSTHSPFIVRGASLDANIYWMDNGAVSDAKREMVEIALGWGAFGKKIILVSEDKNNQFIKSIVKQWPEIERYVAFQPGSGYRSLLKPEQAEELYETLGGKYKVVLHRDRDALTCDEVENLKKSYESENVYLWVTDYSDLEAYFCNVDIVASVTGIEIADAQSILERVMCQVNETNAYDSYCRQRTALNTELYKNGGSPITEELWKKHSKGYLSGRKGKTIFKKLKNNVSGNKFSENSVTGHELPVKIASSLKELLASLL